MTPITALGSRYGIQGALGRSVKRAAAGYTDWWDLDGTITSCVAAYQPKGAASYSASKTDLSGNSNDAAEGTAPGWNATDGWIYNGISGNCWLATNVVPTNGWSIIARVQSDATSGIPMVASSGAGKEIGFAPYFNSNKFHGWYGASWYDTTTYATTSDVVLATTAGSIYKDATAIKTGLNFTGDNTKQLLIGALYNGNLHYPFYGKIKAVAIYNGSIASYVSDLTTAMAEL